MIYEQSIRATARRLWGYSNRAEPVLRKEAKPRRIILHPQLTAMLSAQIQGHIGLDGLPFCAQCGGPRSGHANKPPHLAGGCTGYLRRLPGA